MVHALVVMLSTLSSLVPVHVAPATGGPRTTFVVGLRAPAATGTTGSMRRLDAVTVTGPRRAGCVWSMATGLSVQHAHQLVHVRLKPGATGSRWCPGTFQGVVTQSETVVCQPGRPVACPMIMIRPETIGQFRFRVTRG